MQQSKPYRRFHSSSFRLSFILILIAFIAGFIENRVIAAPESKTASQDKDAAKKWRKEAANRRRRIIFNNDGAEPVVKMTRPSVQDFLDLRTSALAGSQVDSVFYCSRSSGFGVFTHLTKIGQVFTCKEGRYADNQMEAFAKEGIDPLHVIVDFCKQNKLEVFWSMRMNDTHDGSKTEYGPILFRDSLLKTQHPEYLLGTADERPRYGAWTAVNYGLPEIRELAFRYIEEVCQNYDVDGVELDFFRHPVFFESNAKGELATNSERSAMTELIERVRNMADDVGRKRGRPILIAVRTPDSLEYARAIGLDIGTWFAKDLVDLFIPSGSFQLNQWEYSVKLGRKYGIKVYPSLDESRVKDEEAKKLRMTEFAYRGRATDAWGAGADGVYLYNFFDYLKSDSEILHELGDPGKLSKLDKDYFGSVRGVKNSSAGNLPFESFLNIETLNPEIPRPIEAGKSAGAELFVGEDPSLTSPELTLVLQFKSEPDIKAISIALNGQPLERAKIDGPIVKFRLDPAAIKQGSNQVAVTLAPSSEPNSWLDLYLQVRHPQ
jgi:hypothetical protein